jgi:hypothetical protein
LCRKHSVKRPSTRKSCFHDLNRNGSRRLGRNESGRLTCKTLLSFILFLLLLFMSKKALASWGPVQNKAFQLGFKEKGWDAYETDGKKIKQIVLNDATIFAAVKPWFHKNEGGEKKSTTRFTHNTRVVLVSISRYLPRSGSVEVC